MQFMQLFIRYTFWLYVLIISTGIPSVSAQKIYEVDPNRELTREESIVPTFYQHYGPYLFFLSQPAYDMNCCSVLPAYNGNSLWRLDSTDNSVKQVVDDIEDSIYEETNPYALLNDRIIYFSSEGLISTNLSGLDKKVLSPMQHGRLDFRGNQMVSYNGFVYFPLYGGDYRKTDLWRTDGTTAGTTKVELCDKNTCYGSPRQMTLSSNKLFFVTSSAEKTSAIWSISLENNPQLIAGVTLSSDEKIFPVTDGVQFNSSTQLWFTDGTQAGSYPINLLINDTPSTARESISLGNIVVAASNEIYVISDKGKGITTLIDADPKVENGYSHNSFPTQLTPLNNAVYFIVQGSDISKLMSMDTTTLEVQQVFTFSTYDDDELKIIATKGNKLILLHHVRQYSSNNPSRNEIWVSDGTTEGTSKLTEHGVPHNLWNFNAWHFINNDLYFTGIAEDQGIELWRTDSSVPGTVLAKDIGYGQTRVQKGPIASNGQQVFYVMQHQWYGRLDGILGHHTERELWKTDALTMRSSPVAQWNSPDRRLSQIIPVEKGQYWWMESELDSVLYDLVYFDYQNKSVTTVISGMSDICARYDITTRKMITLKNKYFFEAPIVDSDGLSVCQLWVSDGSVNGTLPVSRLPNTSIHAEIIQDLVIYQGDVFFSLIVQKDDYLPLRTAVFKTDGTVSGTGEAFQITENTENTLTYMGSMQPTEQGIFVTTLHTSANTFKTSTTLWFKHPSGINKIIEGTDDLAIMPLKRFKQGISFTYNNQLWSSDGSEQGTYPLISLHNNQYGSCNTDRLYPTPDYQQLIYSDYDENNNCRLWITDGTLEGTKPQGEAFYHGYFLFHTFVDDNFYITTYSERKNGYQYENLMRFSLAGTEPEILRQRTVYDENHPSTVVEVQGRVFIGEESEIISRYGPGFGGPYVTAYLNGNGIDTDQDGFTDNEDAFPLHIDEYQDTDGNGVGDNSDIDDDGDSVEDALDIFPLNALEWADADSDGIGDTADLDDDNDGVNDWLDSYPRDSSRSSNRIIDDVNNNTPPQNTTNSSGGGDIYYLIMMLGIFLVKRNRSY